jgi:hypothetical protein
MGLERIDVLYRENKESLYAPLPPKKTRYVDSGRQDADTADTDW